MATECMVDRLSDLPEGLAHHILSFLSIKDLTRFGIASKTCRDLYLSAPTLNFEHLNVAYDACEEWSRISESLTRFLIRRGDNKIQKFRILQPRQCYPHPGNSRTPCVYFSGLTQSLVWIKMAEAGNMVEVLDLELPSPNGVTTSPILFPSWIFSCASLRSLSMSLLNTIMTAPSLVCLSNLKYLKLKNVCVAEGFFQWISSSCKFIKELHLDILGKSEVMIIESSSLECFSIVSWGYDLRISGEKLQDIRIKLQPSCPPQHASPAGVLNIFAPNLKHLEWFDYPVNQQPGQLWCLGKAEVFLSYVRKNIEEVLCSICRVKVLTLLPSTMRALQSNRGLTSMPKQLEDVSFLQINIDSFTGVPVIVSLFRAMPNLTTLHLKSNLKAPGLRDSSGNTIGYRKLQTRHFAFISELKEVTVEISRLSYEYNAIVMSSFILENAHNLKKMVIIHSPRLPKWAFDMLINSKKTSDATLVVQVAEAKERA